MEKNWVSIYATDKAYRAEIAKEILFENAIQSVIMNKKDSNYLFGLIEICVERKNVVKGKHLLSDLDKEDSPKNK